MTGFEKYLLKNGFSLISGKDKEFTTIDNIARTYEKNGKMISVGLMDKPARIGIRFPPMQKIVQGEITIKEISYKYTYLPVPEKYEEWVSVLTSCLS